MYIDGFGITGYRSFGEKIQLLGPFGKINLIIGQNNSGKSNIILFMEQYLNKCVASAHKRQIGLSFQNIDRHIGSNDGKVHFSMGINPEGNLFKYILDQYKNSGALDTETTKLISSVINSKTLRRGTEIAWFPYEVGWSDTTNSLQLSSNIIEEIKNEDILSTHQWVYLWGRLTNMRGGSINQDWIPDTLRALSPVKLAIPEITVIPAIRQVLLQQPTSENDYSGSGLIDRLVKLQNPNYDQQHLRQRFNEINEFLRFITGNTSTTLEIPHDRSNIIIHMDNRTLPLSSLGTGIHEVVILAAAATVLNDQIICIEEPEIHLHPILQKKLLQYLNTHTSNQYFITTHSAHLLDFMETSVFHIKLHQGQSIVENALTAKARSLICFDLGYKPSDLLQSNCIIWVEGPSDRLYLNYWIRSINPSLVEGFHYSIMFYGGRLLSHLSALEPEIDDFISLRRLNRHISIVIDSDIKGPHNRINNTKKRIKEEFDQDPGFAWITKGREIENYIPASFLEQAIKVVHPQAESLISTGIYDHCLHFKDISGKIIERVDKVRIAQEVINLQPPIDILDLRQKIHQLIQFIKHANHMN